MLGNQNGGSPDGDADIDGKMPGVAPHDFDHGGALVGLHGVRQLIDGVDGGIGRGVEADGIMRAGDVVIDRSGDADGVDAEPCEIPRAAEGAVPADGDDAVDTKVLTVCYGRLHARFGFELLAAGGVEDGAAARGDAVDGARVELHHVRVYEAVVPAVNAHGDNIVQYAGAHGGADGCVHARRVPAAGEDADSTNSVWHRFFFDPFYKRLSRVEV
ncbi:hypothetical protein SDC9_110569 [bioreactor metagenome]|uniref:Uncharacterized protein n=1 Tax=bioreactor metagenome TaxID=1076179 RepID=A0A645BF59_9ZZZZ